MTSYTPLPQPLPTAGIAIKSVTYSSSGSGFFNRFIDSRVTDIVVVNFGSAEIIATSQTLYYILNNSSAINQVSFPISMVIPANSTVDIPGHAAPTGWGGSGSFYYVVVDTAEGYTATSDQFAFPILGV
jgi:hypothetical protein